MEWGWTNAVGSPSGRVFSGKWVSGHVYTIEKAADCVENWLEEEDLEAVNFEDNLGEFLIHVMQLCVSTNTCSGAHKTKESRRSWRDFLPRFRSPRYFPVRLTAIVQSIDRHLGIIYKRAVYRGFRLEFMNRMRTAGPDIRPEPMTASDKRIPITKTIADTHSNLWTTTKFYRSFIATGTWMPVQHLIPDMNTASPGVLQW